MSLPRHSSYKPSGDQFLGDIPSDWRTVQLREIASVINGYPFDSGAFSPDGPFPLVRIRDLNSSTTATRYSGSFVEAAAVTSEDLLVGMDGDFNVGRWLGDGKALLNQRMCCVRSVDPLIGRLVSYVLPFPLKMINEVTYATTVKHLSSSQVEKVKLALPPDRAELAAVLDVLDRETAKIDALAARQSRLMSLLAEKRSAFLFNAITKGLDRGTRLKDSGVSWIGEVPEMWSVRTIRSVARLESGHTPSRNRPEWWVDCNTPWFTLGDVWQIREANRDYVDETAERVSELGLANSSARLLPAGTVMLSRTASVGFSAIMKVPMATSQDFANWVCGDQLLPEYLLYALRCMRQEFSRLMMGSTHNTIYMPDIRSLRIPLPPVDEQRAIVDRVRGELSKIDGLVSQADALSTLLIERRAALIRAVATGKVDSRGAIVSQVDREPALEDM